MTRPAVELLDKQYDYNRLLAEFLACQSDGILPSTYYTLEVYNRANPAGYPEDIIKNCPYTISVVEDIRATGVQFNFALFRLIAPRTTLSWHIDNDCGDKCYHVPIISNAGCFYLCEGIAYSMDRLGTLYQVRTHDYHTSVNAGDVPRVHLHLLQDWRGRYLSRTFKG